MIKLPLVDEVIELDAEDQRQSKQEVEALRAEKNKSFKSRLVH